MEKENLKIQVDITEDDIYSYQKSMIPKHLLPIYATIAIACLIAFILVPLLTQSIDPMSISIRIAVFFVILLFVLWGIPSMLRKSSKTALNTNKLLHKTQYYSFNVDGIEASTETSTAFVKWSELYKAVESKDSFQLFISKAQAYVIPKRCFNGNTEQMTILSLLISNAPVPKDETKKTSFMKKLLWGLAIYIIIISVLYIAVLFLNRG